MSNYISRPSPSSTSHQAVKFLTAASVGAVSTTLSGLTLTGTIITLVIATPILVLCSPVLVPAVIATCLFIAGLFFSGGCGLAAVMAFTWVYSYMTGDQHPLGADKLNYAKEKIAEKAMGVKERAKEYGHYVQQKAQEATAATN